ncbi:hypothetical protein N7537_007634 [Penicillium hordei]|uniref:Uncharacterized protein n=1 Tax=Penicillium hordei TaxID=40994 RepID=A0AAD6DZ63_9EURO|nr:uncharacterized protein N7537_007634 [Penicillium hordei]KAJ5597550.1 hypothetical protein N7537_007634 [Penicillium hordei]
MEHDIPELRRRLAEAEQRENEAKQREIEKPPFQSSSTLAMLTYFLAWVYKQTQTRDPANADNKLRPAKIREWMGFPQEQTAV